MCIFILIPLLYIYYKKRKENIYLYYQIFLLSILANSILIMPNDCPYEIITQYLIYLSLSHAYLTDIIDHKVENDLIIFMLLYKIFSLLILGMDRNDFTNILLSILIFVVLFILSITTSFGMGDVKLIFSLSLLMGFEKILIILLYASLISSIYGILSLVFRYNKLHTEIPFVPFIYLGYIISILLN